MKRILITDDAMFMRLALKTMLERNGFDFGGIYDDFEKLGRLTHELKGSSGTLRITSIYELALKLEQASIKQEIDACDRLFTQIKDVFH